MVKFDINGANVEFDEKTDNYNSIRKLFCKYASESALNFENTCYDTIKSIKQFSEKGLNYGEILINDVIKKSIECIVGYGVITVDFEIFKDVYCKKYLNYQRLFNNINKELFTQYKNKKNNKMQDLKPTIKKLSTYLYNDCFNIHLAVVDVLIAHGVTSVRTTLDNEDIKKANALFNNYKDGFITKPDECRVVKQIISLNPYRLDVYEFLVKEDGDFTQEIERLTEYLGYNIKPYKSILMDIYIKKLIENQEEDIELAKEKLNKYARYIGCNENDTYMARIESIYSFENA